MGLRRNAAAATTIAGAFRSAPAGRNWFDRVKAIPSMARAVLSGRWKGTSRVGVGMSLLGLLYVISPIDVIPDFLLGMGLVDDLGIAVVSVAYLVKSVDSYLDWQDGISPGSGEVIEGVVIDS